MKGGESKMRKLLALFIALLFATTMTLAAGCAKEGEAPKAAGEKAEKAKPGEPAKPAEASPVEKK